MILWTRRRITDQLIESFESTARSQVLAYDSERTREWRRHRIERYNRIAALGPLPDPDTVQAIVGDMGHTTVPCEECDAWVPQAVEIGYCKDGHTHLICGDCLIKALNLTEENC